jgi:hypothetical protein
LAKGLPVIKYRHSSKPSTLQIKKAHYAKAKSRYCNIRRTNQY